LADLLGTVSGLLVQRGPEVEVVVLGKRDTSIGDLQHMRAVLDKAGYKVIRLFVYDPARQMVSEVTIEFLGTKVGDIWPASAR